MSKRIAVLGIAAALLGAAGLPGAAGAADLYGYGGDEGPPAFRGRGDVLPEDGGYRRGPGPVVFDERGGGPRYADRYGEGVPAGRPGWNYGAPGRLPPPPYGYGPGAFRPAAVYGATAGPDFGGPEGGCTVEQFRSVTPAGWQKVVTHRTCYRR